MIAIRTQAATQSALRVALNLRDRDRVNALARLLETAGHLVVERVSEADVLIADGDAEMEISDAARTIVLGNESDGEPAGILGAHPDAAELDAAVRAVAAGLSVRTRNDGFASLQETKTEVLLTPRELEVLTAIGEGHSNKAIARQLEISLHTVKFHIESIFRKLGVRSRAEAVAKGWERARSVVEV